MKFLDFAISDEHSFALNYSMRAIVNDAAKQRKTTIETGRKEIDSASAILLQRGE